MPGQLLFSSLLLVLGHDDAANAMTSWPSHPRTTQWTARVLMLAALALVLSAARGKGGCGDHVRLLPESGVGHSLPDEPAPSGPRPCHGPTCSQRDPQPMPPGAPARVVPPEDLRQTPAESF